MKSTSGMDLLSGVQASVYTVYIHFRFFSSSQAVGDRKTERRENNTDSLGNYKPVHSNTANVYSASDDVTVGQVMDLSGDKSVAHLRLEQQGDASPKNKIRTLDSPKNSVSKASSAFKFGKGSSKNRLSPSNSAFNWSNFTFRKTNSTENVSQSPEMSESLKQPFKTVKQEKEKCDQVFEGHNHKDVDQDEADQKSDKSATECALGDTSSEENTRRNETEVCEDIQQNQITRSQSSYPCSIDSMCISQSSLAEHDSQPSLPSLGEEDSLSLIQEGLSIKRVPSLSLYFKPSSQKSSSELSDSQSEEGVYITRDSAAGEAKVVFVIQSDDEEQSSAKDSQSKVSY